MASCFHTGLISQLLFFYAYNIDQCPVKYGNWSGVMVISMSFTCSLGYLQIKIDDNKCNLIQKDTPNKWEGTRGKDKICRTRRDEHGTVI